MMNHSASERQKIMHMGNEVSSVYRIAKGRSDMSGRSGCVCGSMEVIRDAADARRNNLGSRGLQTQGVSHSKRNFSLTR